VHGSSSWKIASTSTGSSATNVIYKTGDRLNTDGVYYVYPNVPCFLEGSTILCQVNGQDTYLPIETITPGTLVKTPLHGYKAVALIGKAEFHNPAHSERIQNRLYKCSPSAYPELNADLYITGCHSILVDSITDHQKDNMIAHLGKIFITDRKYRLIACADERAEPWNSEGMYTIWHVALEHEDHYMNHGVWANGLLVESCSINFMKNKSNLTLL
jgi:hypothetical protein